MFGRRKSVERRTVQRYAAEGTVALGWRDGAEFHTADATLINISQHGACIATARAPVPGSPAWILIGGGTEETWLRGVVIDVTRDWRGRRTLRFRFDDPCPYDFMRASIRGMAIGVADETPRPEEYRDGHFWR
jgi:hypothetical protein